jgi:hypothetical protein
MALKISRFEILGRFGVGIGQTFLHGFPFPNGNVGIVTPVHGYMHFEMKMYAQKYLKLGVTTIDKYE